MSSTSPNTLGKRRDTLELKGDLTVATDEQIRQHKPELFEANYYLNRLARALEGMKFTSEDPLKSHLDEEGQQKLEAYVSHLTEAIQKTISQTPFEFVIEQPSQDNGDETPVTRNHDFTVAVSNAEALLESVKQPLENLKVLHDLFDLIDTLEKRIEGLKESLESPSAREKNSIGRSEIEIRVLEDELSDFEEYEKTGKPTTHQRNQKKQLKDNLEKHREIIRKIKAKAKKKKERITFTQETLDQVAALFTEFLAQNNPETSVDFSAELDLTKVLNDNEINTDHVSTELNRILQTERTGDYTAYYPEVENQQRWDERKQALRNFRDRLKKWAPRAAVILAIAGAGAYLAREQIADVFDGSRSSREQFLKNAEESARRLREWGKAAKIVLLKHILSVDPYLNEYFTDRQKSRLLSAETHTEFLDMLNDFLPGVKTTDFDDLSEQKREEEEIKPDTILVELEPEHVRVFKEFFGDNVEMALQAVDAGDVLMSSPKPSLKLGKIQFCKPGLEFRLVVKIRDEFKTFVLKRNFVEEHCEYGKIQDTKPLGFEGKFLMTDRTQPDTDAIFGSPYVTQEHKEMNQKARGIEEIAAALGLAVNDIAERMTSDGYEAEVNADKTLSEEERKLLLLKAEVFKNPFLSRYMEYGEKMMVLYVKTEGELKDLLRNSVAGIEKDEWVKARLFEDLFELILSNGGWPVTGVVKLNEEGQPAQYIRYNHRPEAVKAIRAEFGESIGLRFNSVVDGKASSLVEVMPQLAISLKNDFPAEEFCSSEIRADATATVLIPVIDKIITFKDRFTLNKLDSIRENFCKRADPEVDPEVEALKQEILFHPMIIRYVNESHALDADKDQFMADFKTLETVRQVDAYLKLILEEVIREKVGEEEFLDITEEYSKIMLMNAPTINKKLYVFLPTGITKALRQAFGESIEISLDFSGLSKKVKNVDPFIINQVKQFGATDEDFSPLTLAIETDDLCADDSRFIIEVAIPIGNLYQRFIASFNSPFAGRCDLVEQIKPK